MNNINYNTMSPFNLEKPDTDLTSPEVGFKRGNIFENLYSPYKKSTYNFSPENEREKLMLEIMETCFYAHELNLYLDNYPNDTDKLSLFMQYNDLSNKLIEEYERKYSPILLSGNRFNSIPWTWVESPWPWEGV